MQQIPPRYFPLFGRRIVRSALVVSASLLIAMTGVVGVGLAAAASSAPFALISPQKADALERATHRTRGAALREGEKARGREPHPMSHLQIEGTLPHHGAYDESVEAVKDFAAARDLALAGRLTRNPEQLRKSARIISSWISTYGPTYNPVDETQLDNLFIAYDLLPADIKAPISKEMNRFLRRIAEGYLERIPAVSDATATNNWQSHRVKLITLTSYALGDQRLIAQAREVYRAQIAANIRPDGSTIDFGQRDAVHYAVYDLEPLCMAALAAKEHGEDWYHWKSPSGVGLEDALLWLRPYAEGRANHEEFVHSRVKFDAERRKAGVKGFGGKFDRKSARAVMTVAARLDPRFIPIAKELGWHTPLFDLVWPLND